MKIITIPDLHGKNCWNKLNPKEYDKIIFLGDYVDSKGKFSNSSELANLEAIIQLKVSFPDKVVLLLGNHDIQYLHYPDFKCANFNYAAQKDFTALFQTYKPHFQAAWQIDNHLWTHAGVSRSWYHEYALPKLDQNLNDEYQMAAFLNSLHHFHPEILATIGPPRKGRALYGGIFWADKSETEDDFIDGFHQYVGHTKVLNLTKKERDADSSISYLDCLNNQTSFLISEF